jgi:hypothetical protein
LTFIAQRSVGRAAEAHGLVEAECAASRHRFARELRVHIKELRDTLTKLGDAVNRGDHNAFDVTKAKFEILFVQLSDATRTLRFTNGKQSPTDGAEARGIDSYQWVTKEQMDEVSRLVFKRANDQKNNTFVVFAPQHLLDNSSILKTNGLAHGLRNEPFAVSFQDGTVVALTFAQLAVFVYQLIFLSQQMEEISQKLNKADLGATAEISLKTTLNLEEIMSDNMLKVLLSKVEFSPISAERASRIGGDH